ncbi:MAG: hypothetical protein BWY03_00280 [Parcubacteria group bacterium ADurb.Bin159]|jgi:SHS2 domain-containing protein|nr:MAG: hypothetical protein BWY03_00280 [Parcubacteria group bacterium ADurb.Bin159]
MKKNYKFLEHTADLKVQTEGKNLEELFLNVLTAVFEACRPEIKNKKLKFRKINIKAEDLESLLINFLSEVLYLSDINNEIYFKARFDKLTHQELIAEICGYKVERFGLEIKAVTWHDLEIKKQKRKWQATILFDI